MRNSEKNNGKKSREPVRQDLWALAKSLDFILLMLRNHRCQHGGTEMMMLVVVIMVMYVYTIQYVPHLIPLL